MLVRTLERFRPLGLLDEAVIVAPAEALDAFRTALDDAFPEKRFRLAAGGPRRQDSVANGLELLSPGTEVVVIHDAARPFASTDAIRASIDAAAEYGAATVAIPSVDTILQADPEDFLVDTPDRDTLWACQTPQAFRVDVIRRAHAEARADQHAGTDDASLVRRMGGTVKLVMGSPLNVKVTTPSDLVWAECIIREGLA